MTFQQTGLCSKIILSLSILFPMAASAHLISITPTVPFPHSVPASTVTTATYTVKNISSSASVTVIDQSSFPSGLSITSSTCGSLLNPGKSCTIQVSLQATSPEKTIVTELREWASPTADAVQYPINIQVTNSSLPTITLQAVNSNLLPAVRDPVMAKNLVIG